MFGRKNRTAPEADPTSIGNLAIERELITQGDLEQAIQIQKERLPIGKILIEMGKLTDSQLEELLFEQRVLRGEVKDKKLIAEFEKVKKRRRMDRVKDTIRGAGQQVKILAANMNTTAEAVKAK